MNEAYVSMITKHSNPRFFLLLFIPFASIIPGYTNFHEVTPGVLYRSKQLTGKQIDHYVHKYGIKTIINLRGASSESRWYKKEIATAQKDSVVHLDIKLSSIRYVSAAKLDSIMTFVMACRKPLLVHCLAGADRTGLFCAAWKLKVEHQSPEKAEKQLSFIYGHITLLKNSTWAMDSSFRDYARFLGYEMKR